MQQQTTRLLLPFFQETVDKLRACQNMLLDQRIASMEMDETTSHIYDLTYLQILDDTKDSTAHALIRKDSNYRPTFVAASNLIDRDWFAGEQCASEMIDANSDVSI
jgi:hypothetical protein